MIGEIVTSVFLLLGALFVLLSGIGILRFPDLYTRIHALSKSTSFGIALLLVALIIYNPAFNIIVKALFVIVFLFTTSPLASHMIARAAYILKIPYKRKGDNDQQK